MAPFPDFLVRALRRRIAPTKTVGTPGVAIYAGYVESDEINRELADPETRYKTYGDMLANTSIIAAGVRYFLNMVGGAKWTFEPAEADASGEYAERLEKILTEDPMTPWHRIVRRACMYRFFGFSVQEWIVRRHEEGHLTYADIAPRSQRTIYRWDVEPTGEVKGMVQRIPQTGLEVYIPRNKVLYLVDDSINDSPEGLGLFRHLVEPSKRLERYQELEGYGFETDLRGIPIGYGPFAELAEKVAQKELTPEDRDKIEKPLRDFIKGHVRSPKLAAVLDSAPYTTTDEAGRPSNMRQWQIDLLKGSSQSFKENAAAIERLTRDMARILNVEHLLLGSTSAGSFALSEDKSQAFHQVVDGALREVGEAVSARSGRPDLEVERLAGRNEAANRAGGRASAGRRRSGGRPCGTWRRPACRWTRTIPLSTTFAR